MNPARPPSLSTGLRRRQRDASLPARAGDKGLSPPSEEALRRQLAALLLEPDAPAITEIDWQLARWKPGVALTCTYRLRFADGREALVAWKRGKKAGELAARRWPAPRDRAPGRATPATLRPFGVDSEAGIAVWSFPCDRSLRGLTRALDPRRTARRLEERNLVPPRALERDALTPTLLRYKPERRAVLHLHAPWTAAGEPGVFRAAVRVLPAAVACRVAIARRALGSAELPRLLAWDEARGILLEEWLDLPAQAADDFSRAADAGAALARLHRRPAEIESPSAARALHDELAPLFQADSMLVRLGRGLRAPSRRGRPGWTHGDFHPDQLALAPAGDDCRLLDLDELHVGDTSSDLASWIADALIEGAAPSVEAAAEPLLEGYRTGGAEPPALADLRAAVAVQLAMRAAATLRRLEVGAVERAREWLAGARRIAPAGEVFA